MKGLVVLIQIFVASLAFGDVRAFGDPRSATTISAPEESPTAEASTSQASTDSDKKCTPVTKPVRYAVVFGDHLAIIVHRFGFRPLYGKGSQVKKIGKLNGLGDPNVIIAGQEILLPFRCEEDALKHALIDRQDSRLIESRAAVAETVAQPEAESNAPRLPSASAAETKVETKVETTQNTQQASAEVAALAPEKPYAASESDATQFVPYSSLSIGGLYGYYRLDSKELVGNGSALLLSKPSLGIALGWDLHWEPAFTTGFRLTSRSIEFQRATNGVLNNGEQRTSGVGLDFKYRLSEKFKSSLGLSFDERLFARSVQTGTAILETYHQPSIDLMVEHELIRAGALGMDFMAGYRHLLKSSTESASFSDSSEYLLGATFRQQLEKRQIELKINYVTGEQKSSLATQQNAGIETYIGIRMDIGK